MTKFAPKPQQNGWHSTLCVMSQFRVASSLQASGDDVGSSLLIQWTWPSVAFDLQGIPLVGTYRSTMRAIQKSQIRLQVQIINRAPTPVDNDVHIYIYIHTYS